MFFQHVSTVERVSTQACQREADHGCNEGKDSQGGLVDICENGGLCYTQSELKHYKDGKTNGKTF